jgi:hypothetical protein
MLTLIAFLIGAAIGLVSRWFSPAKRHLRGFISTAGLAVVGSVGFIWLGFALNLCCTEPREWRREITTAVVGALAAMLYWNIEIRRRF